MARTPPRSGYFEPEAHPASTIEYTASDDMASTNSRLTLRSAPCRVTVASPMCTGAPIGTTMKMRNAGIIAAIGAARYIPTSTLRGRIPSLNISFSPSARVCRIPKGPARFGPIRFCMNATTRRSNHTSTSAVSISNANTAMALISPDHKGVVNRVSRREVIAPPLWGSRPDAVRSVGGNARHSTPDARRPSPARTRRNGPSRSGGEREAGSGKPITSPPSHPTRSRWLLPD